MRLRQTAIAANVSVLTSIACARSSAVSTQQTKAESSRRVEGIVVDSLGRPIREAAIMQSLCPNGHLPCNDGLQLAACTSESGRFAFDLPATGLFMLVATVNGAIVGDARVVVSREQAETVRIEARGAELAWAMRREPRPCVPSSGHINPQVTLKHAGAVKRSIVRFARSHMIRSQRNVRR